MTRAKPNLTPKPRRRRERARRMPDQYAIRRRCDNCRSADVVKFKTFPVESDDSLTMYVECRTCGAWWLRIEE